MRRERGLHRPHGPRDTVQRARGRSREMALYRSSSAPTTAKRCSVTVSAT
jgi:hypothetical protein